MKNMNIPMEIVLDDEDGSDVAVNTVETLVHLQRDVKEQRKLLEDQSATIEKQNELLKILTEKMDQQHQLLEGQHKLLEESKQTNEVKKGFLSIFGFGR